MNQTACKHFISYINTLSDLIKHAVEEAWDHREDCRLQRFQIIHQKSNVPLKIADSSPMDEDDTLMENKSVQHCVHQRAVLLLRSSLQISKSTGCHTIFFSINTATLLYSYALYFEDNKKGTNILSKQQSSCRSIAI